jgi:hypothetical protein
MRIVSMFFGVSACILAVIALVFSAILFGYRNEYVMRADSLAVTLCDVVKALDQDSGTKDADETTFKPGNPVDGTPAGGTTSAMSYHGQKTIDGQPDQPFYKALLAKREQLDFPKFKKRMAAAKEQAGNIIKQRNDLAQGIGEISETLRMPKELGLNKDNLRLVTPAAAGAAPAAADAGQRAYQEEMKKVTDFVAAVADRDEKMVLSLITIASTVGISIEQTRFSKPDSSGRMDISGPLLDVQRKVSAYKTRADNFTDGAFEMITCLQKAVIISNPIAWKTDPQALKGEDRYQDQITNLLTDATEIVQRLSLIDKLTSELESKNNEIQILRAENTNMKETLNNWDKLILHAKEKWPERFPQGTDPDNPLAPIIIPEMPDGYRGRIRIWNPDFGFAILDFGGLQGAQAGMMFVIARPSDKGGDPKILGRVKITSVRRNNATADFLGEYGNPRDIQAGDDVILTERPAKESSPVGGGVVSPADAAPATTP